MCEVEKQQQQNTKCNHHQKKLADLIFATSQWRTYSRIGTFCYLLFSINNL